MPCIGGTISCPKAPANGSNCLPRNNPYKFTKSREQIKNKVDKEEVDQLKEEIGSIREGQKQVLEEQWKKIEENLLNHQKENTVKIKKGDIINVNDVIEKKIKEKIVEERARKDRRNNMVIFLELKNVKQ